MPLSPNPNGVHALVCVYACLPVCTCMCVCISLGCWYWWLWGKVNGPRWLPEYLLSWAGTNRSFPGERARASEPGSEQGENITFWSWGSIGHFSYPRTYSKWRKKWNPSVLSCEYPSVLFKPVRDSFRSQVTRRIFTNVSMSNEMLKWRYMLQIPVSHFPQQISFSLLFWLLKCHLPVERPLRLCW